MTSAAVAISYAMHEFDSHWQFVGCVHNIGVGEVYWNADDIHIKLKIVTH